MKKPTRRNGAFAELKPGPVRGRPPTPGLRARILRAAEPEFAGRDFHRVLMDDVARAAGVGKGTLYRYFPSKQDLYGALVLEGMAQLRIELEAAAAAPIDPIAKLEGLARAFLEHVWRRRPLLLLLRRNENAPDRQEMRELRRRRAGLTGAIERVLEQGVKSGTLRGIDVRLGAEMFLGALRGADERRKAGDRLGAIVADVVDLFLAGAGAAARAGVTPPRRIGGAR